MRKILLVEDEPMLRDVYGLILGTQPYTVDIASNGKEALDKCDGSRYDLILLDLMMPVIDGVGFLEQFASLGVLPTKVIILSNLSSGKELFRAMALGAHRSVLKADLTPSQLLTTIRYELEC